VNLSASQEDYLEAIFNITAESPVARVKEIASRLNVNNSSVTGALRQLADKELINYEPYGHITLTNKGKRAGSDVVKRHATLCGFLTKVLDINNEFAEESACKIEHVLPERVKERLAILIEEVERDDSFKKKLSERFL
jgi:DtxR family Mn-dependent transcriptional regulator